jgi:hypothetical protein
VPNIQPIVTPDAVKQLVDAVHNGFINTQDIVDRIGAVGQAKKRALLEELGEYVSPDAIKARTSAYGATAAQNQLAQQTAQAGSQTLPGATALAQQQIAKQQATNIYGEGGLDTLQKIGPWYGESMQKYVRPDGTTDFAKAAQAGNDILAKNNALQSWLTRLTPASTKEITDTAGQKHLVVFNAFNEDVTPPQKNLGANGSDTYWYYVHQINQLMPDTHPMRGQIPIENPSEGERGAPGIPIQGQGQGTPGPVRTIVTPQNEGTYRAEYAQYLKTQGAEDAEQFAAKASPETIQGFVDAQYPLPSASAQPTVTPVATTPAPAQAQLVTPVPARPPTLGYITQPGETAPEVYKTEIGKETYKKWAESVGYYNSMADAVRNINKFTPQQQRMGDADLNAEDIGLVSNFIKLHDPQAVIREFKWDKLVDQAARIPNFKSLVERVLLKKGALSPEQRQNLWRVGRGAYLGKEKSIQAGLAQAQQLGKQLDANESRIASGAPPDQDIPVVSPAGEIEGATAQAAGPTVTLPSGRKLRWVPNP